MQDHNSLDSESAPLCKTQLSSATPHSLGKYARLTSCRQEPARGDVYINAYTRACVAVTLNLTAVVAYGRASPLASRKQGHSEGPAGEDKAEVDELENDNNPEGRTQNASRAKCVNLKASTQSHASIYVKALANRPTLTQLRGFACANHCCDTTQSTQLRKEPLLCHRANMSNVALGSKRHVVAEDQIQAGGVYVEWTNLCWAFACG